MREIKFRAWTKKSKRMCDVLGIDYCEEEIWLMPLDNALARDFRCRLKNVELMQYTGMEDKNRCEIYEGDVVKFISRLDSSKRMGTVGYWAGDAAFLIECEREIFYLFHDALNREVIGNIYENPEILRGAK